MRQGKLAGFGPFFGLKLDLRRREKLCADICAHLANPDGPGIFGCLRQHSLSAVKLPHAHSKPELFDALAKGECLSADGMGIVWAARLLGISIPERVTGIDLMTDLLARFSTDQTRVFLLGAKPDVLEKLQANLLRTYPGLVIAGAHHGYEPDDAKLAEVVRQSHADALFVALPSPRKELFVDQFAPQTGCRFAMGVGGAFDVLAGDIQRAPKVWQRAGLEFLWRICCQPRYMLPRYASGLFAFAKLVGPEIGRVHFSRLRSALQKAAIASAVGLVLLFGADGRAASFTEPDFDLADREAAITWLQTSIAAVSNPADIRRLIDVITEMMWVQGVLISDQSIRELLDLFEALLTRAGANSFLIETVFGGVLAHLSAMHPMPDQFSAIVMRNASGAASRLAISRHTDLASFAETRPFVRSASGRQLDQEVSQRATVKEQRRFGRFTQLDEGTADGPAITSWTYTEHEDVGDVPELEDASPR